MSSRTLAWRYSRPLRALSSNVATLDGGLVGLRCFSSISPLQEQKPQQPDNEAKQDEKQQGAMSKRLSEMAEEMIDSGSKSDQKIIKEAGFSEDLKRQLEERIAQSSFSAQHQRAMSEVTMPTAAGKGTRDQAAARPWTGSEALEDVTLRMLDDSHKKLRTPARSASIAPRVNLRPPPKKQVSAADRLANARDKSSIYAFSQQNDMTEKEREQMRRELKERFTPGARPMPTSLQGLTSLANERIEDAIARGQFKNIPRGKGKNVERDYTANSPFLDTTEYFMNKIIQKQEIVPPWIEKQQELIKMVTNFRGRLRNDWRRHAARMIASSGGRVEDHVRRAKAFALTEQILNPRIEKRETMSGISSDGTLTTVTLEERLAAGVMEEPKVEITVTEKPAEEAGNNQPEHASTTSPPTTPSTATTSTPDSIRPMPYPFRDPTWEATEKAYHTLAIAEINALARSYNLMAPKIAQKPYYNLERELNRCFSDVAATLADDILERSRKPQVKIQVIGHKEGGVMERFGANTFEGHVGRVRDEPGERGYGFKEFWRDLFGKEKDERRRVL